MNKIIFNKSLILNIIKSVNKENYLDLGYYKNNYSIICMNIWVFKEVNLNSDIGILNRFEFDYKNKIMTIFLLIKITISTNLNKWKFW